MSKRKQNWSSDEIESLVDHCSKSTAIVSGKFSSTLTAFDKSNFWATCSDSVNSVGCSSRTVDEVKKKWVDIKSSTKKKAINNKKEGRQTGGGPPPTPLKDWEEKVVGALPGCVIDGVVGGMDTFEMNAGGDQVLTVTTAKKDTCSSGDCPSPQQSTSTSDVCIATPDKTESKSKSRRKTLVSCTCAEKIIAIEQDKLALLREIVQLKKRSIEIKEKLNMKRQRIFDNLFSTNV